MSIGAFDAAAAYGRALGTGSSAGISKLPSAGGTSVAGSGGSFGSMVEEMVTDTTEAMRGAEQASARQVAGQGDLIDVVTAIGAAETALDTVVAVRDRVVSAYGEIMRMQI
ncbi:flagellar hook-basal body complex protein FliE [Novosphingobium sp. RD2P27]|uniref:Flagellar hook-basal body complex protein FliE n=1 Tax=Novosphingobium kalidii TaxID=3230299 RepID=A0ABV2CXN8_9SPHN